MHPDTPQDPTALFNAQGPKVVRVDFNFNGTGDTHFSYLTHKSKEREIVCHSPANMTADQHARLAQFAKAIDKAVSELNAL
jgi:hypothetical protein